MFPPPNGIEMFAEFYLRMGVSQMKMNRWFSVALLVGVSAMSNESLVSTYADDTAKPGHSHEPAKSDEAKIKAAIAKLPEADRSAAAGQRYCPMMDTVRLGAMGAPVKVMIDGKPVFLCCEGCKDEAVEHGKETLTKVEKLKKAAIAVAKLPAADQPLAEAQLYCPIVKDSRLGSYVARAVKTTRRRMPRPPWPRWRGSRRRTPSPPITTMRTTITRRMTLLKSKRVEDPFGHRSLNGDHQGSDFLNGWTIGERWPDNWPVSS
jgi:hypothetical protein